MGLRGAATKKVAQVGSSLGICILVPGFLQMYFLSIPQFPVLMTRFASGVHFCSTISLSSSGGIPSTSGDLLFHLLDFLCGHFRSYK